MKLYHNIIVWLALSRINIIYVPGEDAPWIYQASCWYGVAPKNLTQQASHQFLLLYCTVWLTGAELACMPTLEDEVLVAISHCLVAHQ